MRRSPRQQGPPWTAGLWARHFEYRAFPLEDLYPHPGEGRPSGRDFGEKMPRSKDNLLEAMAYLSPASPHRLYDRELIQFGVDQNLCFLSTWRWNPEADVY